MSNFVGILLSVCIHFSCIFNVFINIDLIQIRERSGSVVECLTRNRGAAGLNLTGVTALWSALSKTHLS